MDTSYVLQEFFYMLGDISKWTADPVSDAFDKHHIAFQDEEARVLETKLHEGKNRSKSEICWHQKLYEIRHYSEHWLWLK